MAASDKPPEFDPATWTPDKPWPKGYYKPVLGLTAAIERGGSEAGYRRFFWVMFAALSQGFGTSAILQAAQAQSGLRHAVVAALTPWPLLLLFVLVIPALLYAVIVPVAETPLRRSFPYGLIWSLLLAMLLVLALFLGPGLDVIGNWAGAQLAP